MNLEAITHPVQCTDAPSRVPKLVTLRAYEVYCRVFREQPALITGDCRGGFGIGELIAFLYARSFPQNEWDTRMSEAFRGMNRPHPAHRLNHPMYTDAAKDREIATLRRVGEEMAKAIVRFRFGQREQCIRGTRTCGCPECALTAALTAWSKLESK